MINYGVDIMKYNQFRKKIMSFPLFSSSHLQSLGENEQVLRNQFSRWVKQGLILKLKRGLYVLNSNDRKINPSRVFLANYLYPPSYISLEYALHLYNLIPERVSDITSITTRKTAVFKNDFGVFIYQHLPVQSFLGFREMKDENDYSFFIAEPEKAIVDFIYLNLSLFKRGDLEIFENSYRFQNLSEIRSKKMIDFAQCFQCQKIEDIVQIFSDFVKRSK